MGIHLENFPAMEYFEAVAAACARYLEQAYSAEVARSVAALIQDVGQSVCRCGEKDPFDELRDIRRQLNRLSEQLSGSGNYRAQHECPSRENRITNPPSATAQTTPATDVLLFVYGTLKRGYSRNRLLSGQKFLAPVSTRPGYRLYDCGSYPALVRDPDGLSIQGELWWVTAECVQMLDEVEGVAEGLYQRGCVELQPPFEQCRVQAYFYRQPVAGLRDCGSCWPE